jgi:hypothetical protein
MVAVTRQISSIETVTVSPTPGRRGPGASAAADGDATR